MATTTRLIAAAWITALTAPSALAQTQQDTQLWASVEGQAEVSPRLQLEVEQEIRLGSSAGFDETFTNISGRYDFTDHFAVGAHYRLILREDETRHRVGGDFRAKTRFGRLEPSYRMRLQATSRPNDDTLVPIRHRVQLAIDLPRKLEPFFGAELQFMLSPVSEYRERRFFVGVGWRATKRISLEASYLNLAESNVGQPDSFHVFGVSMSYQVREAKKSDDEP